MCLISLLLFSAALARAQSHSIDKFTIAGGGGTGTGSVYAVSGTIGQPDASGPLSGGTYTLVGGFWALPSAVQIPGAPLLSVEQLAGNSVRIYWPLPASIKPPRSSSRPRRMRGVRSPSPARPRPHTSPSRSLRRREINSTACAGREAGDFNVRPVCNGPGFARVEVPASFRQLG